MEHKLVNDYTKISSNGLDICLDQETLIALRIGRSYIFYSGFRVNGNSRTINNTRELITSWLVHRSVGQKALPLRTPSKVRDPVQKLGLVKPFEFPPIIEINLLISQSHSKSWLLQNFFCYFRFEIIKVVLWLLQLPQNYQLVEEKELVVR